LSASVCSSVASRCASETSCSALIAYTSSWSSDADPDGTASAGVRIRAISASSLASADGASSSACLYSAAFAFHSAACAVKRAISSRRSFAVVAAGAAAGGSPPSSAVWARATPAHKQSAASAVGIASLPLTAPMIIESAAARLVPAR
jgi:hypothetical protein